MANDQSHGHRRLVWLVLAIAAAVTVAVVLTVPGIIEHSDSVVDTTRDVQIVDYKPVSAERSVIPLPPGAAEVPISTEQVCSDGPAVGRTHRPLAPWLSGWLSLPPVFAISVILEGGGHGDVHFGMFNGLRYDFQGVGEFIVLSAKSGSVLVQARQQPFGDSKTISVTTALGMNVGGDIVAVYAGQPAPLRVNHQPASLKEPSIRLTKGGEVRREGNGFVVVWPDKSQVRILYGPNLDYIVSLCPPQHATEGLLGSADARSGVFPVRHATAIELGSGDAGYDQLYHVVGNSWRISQSESLFDYAAGQTTDTFTDLNFPYQFDSTAEISSDRWQQGEAACRQAGISDPTSLRECTLDVAATGQAAFATNAALMEAVYARSGTAGAAGDQLRCRGAVESGWTCIIKNLAGARAGTMVKLTVETIASGQKVTETASCGPITEASEAPCTDRLRGIIFEGGKVVEGFTTVTGETWQRKRPIRCDHKEGEPCH